MRFSIIDAHVCMDITRALEHADIDIRYGKLDGHDSTIFTVFFPVKTS